jgi:hypothetical protein
MLHITVVVWDFDGLDGDSITLAINGQQLGAAAIRLDRYKPGSDESTFRLELPDNDNNVLGITSLSQGSLSFTTLGLLISDGTITQRYYYRLRKGQKMGLRFVRRGR